MQAPVELVLNGGAGLEWMLQRAEEELQDWLKGRNIILWRTRPQFIPFVYTHMGDAQQPLSLTTWSLYSRLTAYRE